MAGWPRNPLVLEINARVWAREVGDAADPRLDRVPDASLESIAGLGFDAVWLMGVWTTGPRAVAEARRAEGLFAEYRRVLPDVRPDDIIGSPYAVSRYQVPAGLGGPDALARLRERLRGHGLRLLLDFVPNHTACDHWLVAERPDAFVQGTEEDLERSPGGFFRGAGGRVVAHGRDPYFAPWTDTAQVDHASAAGRDAMRRELSTVAAQCDGVRCDMAMLVLPDVFARTWGRPPSGATHPAGFWGEAIPAVRDRWPSFLFLAEAYWGLEPPLQDLGFDFTYDKELYDRLRARDAAGARACLSRDPARQARWARFLENHDEPRAREAFGPRLTAAAVVAFLAPGLRLFHEGQLEGRRHRVPVQLARRPAEPGDAATRALYEKLLEVLRRPEARDGWWEPVAVNAAGPGDRTHESLVACLWRADRDGPMAILAVAHLREGEAYGRIPLGVGAGAYALLDRLDGRQYLRDGGEMRGPGLFVALGPHAAHVFELRPA